MPRRLRLAAILFTVAAMPAYSQPPAFTPRDIPASDHYDGARFFNPGVSSPGFLDFLRWQLTGDKQDWPKAVPLAAIAKPPARVDGTGLRVTMVGHATVLIQTAGLNILTDPLWSDRASPFSFIGPKRVTPPGIAFDDLPKIDLILISHNHYDHLDKPTLAKLIERDAPQVIVPLGNGRIIIDAAPLARIAELDWQETYQLSAVEIILQPAQHWSSRRGYDKNKALWGSYVIKTAGGKIYFAGDTGYGPHFAATAAKYGPFRLALLPIGAYEPRWFMHVNHMGPDEGVQAWHDLGKPATIPIHFETVQLADDAYQSPLDLLRQTPGGERFTVLHAGQDWNVE